ncbi:MAG: TolC family protein [Terriglobia bacterium]
MSKILCIAFVLMTLPSWGLAETVNLTLEGTLQKASELSQQVLIAKTGVRTAAAHKDLEKAPFRPQLSVGTGVAATYGFPLSIEGSAPSIFNVNFLQTLYDRKQRKQADAAVLLEERSQHEMETEQQRAALEAGRLYLELRNQRQRHQYYQMQVESLEKTREIIAVRAQDGMVQPRELTKIKLEVAKAKVTLAKNEQSTLLLEEQLRQATGIAAGVSLALGNDEISGGRAEWSEDTLLVAALDKDPTLMQLRVQERSYEVMGDGLTGWFRPVVNLVGRYDLFSRFNDYEKYFNNFQRNNLLLGFSIQVPLIQPSLAPEKRRLQALQDEAQLKIKLRTNEIRAQTLREVTNLAVLRAKTEATRLEAQLARENLQVAQATYEEGKLPLARLEEVRREENTRWLEYLDVRLEEEQIQLNLRKQAGTLLPVSQ